MRTPGMRTPGMIRSGVTGIATGAGRAAARVQITMKGAADAAMA